jgi:hypothetical protein
MLSILKLSQEQGKAFIINNPYSNYFLRFLLYQKPWDRERIRSLGIMGQRPGTGKILMRMDISLL